MDLRGRRSNEQTVELSRHVSSHQSSLHRTLSTSVDRPDRDYRRFFGTVAAMMRPAWTSLRPTLQKGTCAIFYCRQHQSQPER